MFETLRRQTFAVEPPQAEEMARNLIRAKRRFAITQDGSVLRDVCTVTIGGTLVERKETEDYAKSMVCETYDDACQFATNCIRSGFSFAVFATESPGHHTQWSFTAERNRSHGERRNSRVFG